MRPRFQARALTVLTGALLVATAARAQLSFDDPVDPFYHQNTAHENKPLFFEAPNETIDYFTGTVRLLHRDLVLPGKAGLDLSIYRNYNSKIWSRVDYTVGTDAVIAEKEDSPLGWGWGLHMGLFRARLIPPLGFTFEEPSGATHQFTASDVIHSGTNNVYISTDFWVAWDQGSAYRIEAPDGLTYECSAANSYLYSPFAPICPVSKIRDPHGNEINITYVPNTHGAIATITDTWGRVITFDYNPTPRRYEAMHVNGETYQFLYTSINTNFYGLRDFLTEVKPPTGPSWRYAYVTSGGAAANQNALAQVTYPTGATIDYTYKPESFYTGLINAPTPLYAVFAVLDTRTVGGRAVTPATWTYLYDSSAANLQGDTTTVLRPDGLKDEHVFYGLGSCVQRVENGREIADLWRVGHPKENRLAIDGTGTPAEVEEFVWQHGPLITDVWWQFSPLYYNIYTGALSDYGVWTPQLVEHRITRDGKTYTTTYASFTTYNEPQLVTESSDLTRTHTLTYWSPPGSPPSPWIVRNHPLSEIVDIGGSSYTDSWTYDTMGKRLTETKSGVTTTYAYDSSTGDLASITDAGGMKVSLGKYENGTPRVIQNSECLVLRTIDWHGRVVQSLPCDEGATTYVYDANGRLSEKKPPLYNKHKIDYEMAGLDLVSIKESRVPGQPLSWTRTYLDGFGRTTNTGNSESIWTQTDYDVFGNPVFRSLPYNFGDTPVGDDLLYDGLHRLKMVTHPGGSTIVTTYGTGYEDIQDERSYTTRYSYDAFGSPSDRRLREVQPPIGVPTTYTYNTHGSLTTVVTGAVTRTLTYDSMNYLVGEDHPETGPITYTRTKVGLLASRTDNRSRTTRFVRDLLHRVIRVDYWPLRADGPDDVYIRYWPGGKVMQRSSTNGGTTTYGYDAAGKLVEKRRDQDSQAWFTRMAYNANEDLAILWYPTGSMVRYTLDSLGRTKDFRVGASYYVNNVDYHPSGQLASFGRPLAGGLTTTYTHDTRARLTDIVTPGVTQIHHTYDDASNMLSYANAAQGTSKTFTYDALNRLDTATGPWGFLDYGYDDLGNRLTEIRNAQTTAYTYASNQLDYLTVTPPGTVTDFTYDTVGNQVSDGTLSLTWNDANRMTTSSDGATYFYDGDGPRVKKVTAADTTYYHYGLGGELLAETTSAGITKEYFRLGGMLVARNDSSDPTSTFAYLHADHQGSIIAVTYPGGGMVCTPDYDPFGADAAPPPPICSPVRYAGRLVDDGTGLYDLGARYYNPAIGRFIAADVTVAALERPQTWNKYAYVLNNPFGYTDPDGQAPTPTLNAAGLDPGGVQRGGTYYLTDPSTSRVMRTGRTNDLQRRANEHARNPGTEAYKFNVDTRTDSYAEQRGREQVIHDKYDPPLDKLNPIAKSNPNRSKYLDAAKDLMDRIAKKAAAAEESVKDIRPQGGGGGGAGGADIAGGSGQNLLDKNPTND